MKPNYYPIDEEIAKTAHEMMSFSDYKTGSKTREYKTLVDEVYRLADELAAVRPDDATKGYRLADKYSKKMADNINQDSQIGTRCPSVMISGAGNFPTAKKRRQIDAWNKNTKERQEIGKIKDKIVSMIQGKDIIKSGDPNAIERLEKKIEVLEKQQEFMKQVNAYYKKHGKLEGYPGLNLDQINAINASMERCTWIKEKRPFQKFEIANNGQNLRNCKKRLEELKAVKEGKTECVEDESGLYKLIENTDAMRIQFEFNDKPDDDTRTILKANGFRWSPKAGRWQRQLNQNGKYAAKKVMAELENGGQKK